MSGKAYTVEQLVGEVKQGEPVDLSDQELFDVASAALNELRQRMPRYAFEQRDLDWTDSSAVAQMKTAEEACDALEPLAEAWGFSNGA